MDNIFIIFRSLYIYNRDAKAKIDWHKLILIELDRFLYLNIRQQDSRYNDRRFGSPRLFTYYGDVLNNIQPKLSWFSDIRLAMNIQHIHDWVIHWLTDWLTHWLIGLLTVWLNDWLNESETDWLTDWLTDLYSPFPFCSKTQSTSIEKHIEIENVLWASVMERYSRCLLESGLCLSL